MIYHSAMIPSDYTC